MIQKIKNLIFKKKLSKIGFNMSKGSENERLATALNERGLGGDHFVKCMEDAIATKNLQKVCGMLSKRKEAGRYLRREPLVIQCHSCQKNFAIKDGVDFAGKTINLESLENIVNHLISCDGVVCDCGKKVLYFDDCKKCKKKWDKRAIALRKWNPKMRTKEEKKQIKEYNKKFGLSGDDGER